MGRQLDVGRQPVEKPVQRSDRTAGRTGAVRNRRPDALGDHSPRYPASACGGIRSDGAESKPNGDRLRHVLDILPAGVVVLDATGHIQECNPAAEELLGATLPGTLWRDVIQLNFTPRPDDGHEVSLKDGRRINVVTCPLRSEPGQLLLLTDVTETRELQERMSQQRRLADLGEVSATLAHQIRTPLSAAVLYAAHLKRETLPAGDRQRFAEKLLSRLQRMEYLVRDMLLFVRGGGGHRESISVGNLLECLEEGIEAELLKANGRIAIEDKSGHAIVQGNRVALVTALQNLVVNALQASHGDPLVRVQARANSGNHVEICVVDEGPGIPEDLQSRIFEPFFTRHPEGTGLGLAFVRAVARTHQGRISVRSSDGKGTTFTLCLPTVCEEQQAAILNEATTDGGAETRNAKPNQEKERRSSDHAPN